jgi:hypothetical protein
MLVWLHRIQLLKNKNWHEKKPLESGWQNTCLEQGLPPLFQLISLYHPIHINDYT